RLDAEEARVHLEIVRRFVESQTLNAREELLRDSRDRNVVEVDLLLANERDEKVQGSGEVTKLDDEGSADRSRRRAVGQNNSGHGVGSNGLTALYASSNKLITGRIHTLG